MRKLFTAAVSVVLCVLLSSAGNSVAVRIEAASNALPCIADEYNQAQVRLVAGMVRTAQNTHATYVWIVRHRNGTRIWRTDRAERQFEILWTGLYEVQLRIQLNRDNNPWAYQVLYSNKLEIMVNECDSTK